MPVQVVRKDDGPVLRLSDENDRPVAVLSADLPDSGRQLATYPANQQPFVPFTRAPRNPSSGLDAMVFSAEGVARRTAAMTRRFGGGPIARTGGRSTFRTTAGVLEIEAVVDEETGAVLEERFLRNGVVESVISNALARLPDGTHVLQRSHSEHNVSGSSGYRLIIDRVFANVTLAKGVAVQ
jgi:hypothetical protein